MTAIDVAILRAIQEITTRTGQMYARSNHVISEASQSLGLWSLSVENELQNEAICGNETVAAIYNRLVAMIKNKQFASGQGNFGDQHFPPARPRFTDCAITTEGIEYLKKATTTTFEID